MKINNENDFVQARTKYEKIIQKGTELGDFELLSEKEKNDFKALAKSISVWESYHHPLPGKISELITDKIKSTIQSRQLKQKEAAQILGISEARVSDLLNGKRPLNLKTVKRLRDKLGISADFILDNL